jgi:hypothetical protein
MHRTILIFLFTCVPLHANAFENLTPSEYFDSWVAERPISEGEIMELVIPSNGKASLSRDLIDYPDQSFKSSNIEIIDDLHLFTFGSKADNIMYKFVLSGWKSKGGQKKIFGTVFLYQKGGLFNGLPISFVPK